ncbi:hypothetical protein L2E69_18825 [Planktothrix agardhii 1806]|uniref:calcium-binding protein n=1 Tax=Planktothrix agardhii TaxID=1160 RepID=UPI001F1D1E07|nr:calcium-binding protein [Planktothrix agardhii]MCF3572485.1 hypothetical protein [Planktothrix agardhii 1805]MCF3584426.1 hypothetical protein [Planktothrix agardhii 1803]MCF3601110.1 hypothetical protein [Planktothrix agardhii 1804]MCF3617980.1 hypothetical protein [Planktothrix agardhii 1806]
MKMQPDFSSLSVSQPVPMSTGTTTSLVGVNIITITQKDVNRKGQYIGTSGPDYIQVSPFLAPFNFAIYGLEEQDTLSGGAGDDSLFGGKGNDSLIGLNGNDIIQGNLGADYINSGDGNDSVYGGQGNDTLLGGGGNDYLAGDKGINQLTGGFGIDNFSVRAFPPENTGSSSNFIPTNADIITDFTPGEDLIIVSGVPSFAQLRLTSIPPEAVRGVFPSIERTLGGGTLIEVQGTGQIIGFLENIQPQQLLTSSFLFFPTP